MATEPDRGARLAEIRSCAADWRNVPTVAMLRLLLEQYDAQAARLAGIWLQVDLWEQGTEGSIETLERLVALRETGRVD